MKKNDSKTLKVVTSCRSRFHIFDQARELSHHGSLLRLISDYPTSFPIKFDIPKEQIKSLLFTGVIYQILTRLRKYLPAVVNNQISKCIHTDFSKKIIKHIPRETQYFIGLSSFSLEALRFCRANKILCAVDHGSLHQEDERRLVAEEAKRWDVIPPKDTAPQWVIEKEDLEFQAADHIFVLSSVARDSLIRNGISQNKIFINPLGVDLNAFTPGEKKDSVFRVIQVGNITLGKGVLTLIDAFKKANIPNSQLWFVGAGLNSFGLEKKILELKTPNIIFHPPVPQAELQKYYAQASVAVLASVADGFGMVVPQAMACGLPMIVTENVGAKDLITENKNGFIVPIASPEIIAEKLKYFSENLSQAQLMGSQARASVIAGYSWKNYGDRLNDFISMQVKNG